MECVSIFSFVCSDAKAQFRILPCRHMDVNFDLNTKFSISKLAL